MGVNAVTGEVRVRRVTGVFAAGRILDPQTARSQIIGGIIWGIGSALTEGAQFDVRHGNIVNHDLAEYHIPVNADIPEIDVTFLPELDDKTNPLKLKGIGELGISGIGAAVNNAIYHATGVRVRDYPVTLDKLMEGAARSLSRSFCKARASGFGQRIVYCCAACGSEDSASASDLAASLHRFRRGPRRGSQAL